MAVMVQTIYEVTCRTTGLQYVGMTYRNPLWRWREHVWRRGCSEHPFQKAILQYGEADFDLRLLHEVPAPLGYGLERREIEARGYWPNAYNLRPPHHGRPARERPPWIPHWAHKKDQHDGCESR